MRRFLALAVVALALAAGACASQQPDRLAMVDSQATKNRRAVQRLEKELASLRQPVAELQAELASLRQELAQLRGMAEENRHLMTQGRMPAAAEAQGQAADELARRVERLEKYLDLQKAEAEKKDQPPKAEPAPAAEPKTAKQVYDLAHSLRKKKSYQAALDRFQEILDEHPKSGLADNAQYWIGDVYYDQKRYEEAILAFNQVIKRYPKSGKVPSALLKQGLAFNQLGDKRTAKIVLNRLTKNYPKTSQAKTARRVLKKL
jgi:tol-pal system protein YbgF